MLKNISLIKSNWLASLLKSGLAPQRFGIAKSAIQSSYGSVGAVGSVQSLPEVLDVSAEQL